MSPVASAMMSATEVFVSAKMTVSADNVLVPAVEVNMSADEMPVFPSIVPGDTVAAVVYGWLISVAVDSAAVIARAAVIGCCHATAEKKQGDDGSGDQCFFRVHTISPVVQCQIGLALRHQLCDL